MTDNLNVRQRKLCMRAVRAKDSTAEMVVRRLVHAMGYRYALHCANLPGKPDLVFASRRKIIFVHGCFWHRHRCRHGEKMPTTNSRYWAQKFKRNVSRDRSHLRDLRKDGWEILVVWECWTREIGFLTAKIERFLSDST